MDVLLLASAAYGLPWAVVGEVVGRRRGTKDHVLGLGPVYMRSLSDLPFFETLYKARVGLDAGSVLLHKGKRELV